MRGLYGEKINEEDEKDQHVYCRHCDSHKHPLHRCYGHLDKEEKRKRDRDNARKIQKTEAAIEEIRKLLGLE